MTRTEAERIAAAINQLRPDWNPRSILTILGRDSIRHRPAHDATTALVWLAYDPGTRTPARLDQHGPWWNTTPTAQPPATSRPPTTAETCQQHPGGWRGNCAGCEADRKAHKAA